MSEISKLKLEHFVQESNKIEGIIRFVEPHELEAHDKFLGSEPTVESLFDFVFIIAPGHRLRNKIGWDARVGDHIAPAGGPEIETRLKQLLAIADSADPFRLHRSYETLHPFTDGNGRSGRALWLWMMLHHGGDPYVLDRGFLHTWYYQSLSDNHT